MMVLIRCTTKFFLKKHSENLADQNKTKSRIFCGFPMNLAVDFLEITFGHTSNTTFRPTFGSDHNKFKPVTSLE